MGTPFPTNMLEKYAQPYTDTIDRRITPNYGINIPTTKAPKLIKTHIATTIKDFIAKLGTAISFKTRRTVMEFYSLEHESSAHNDFLDAVERLAREYEISFGYQSLQAGTNAEFVSRTFEVSKQNVHSITG